MSQEERDQVEAEKPYPQKCVNCIEVAAIAGVCWGCYRSREMKRARRLNAKRQAMLKSKRFAREAKKVACPKALHYAERGDTPPK